MRHVDLTQVAKRLPKKWPTVASDAHNAIKKMAKTSRAKAINKAPKWKLLRKVLGGVLDNKCWYCESRLKRSPTPIDHYRPKNNVNEAPNHGGYWWLAYSWKNYRFACSHCNSYGSAQSRGVAGGKADYFPLRDEKKRAKGPKSSLSAEQPIILDPAQKADPDLLWFDPNGRILPHPVQCKNPNSYKYKRAMESIRILGLGQDELITCRGKHCEVILELLQDADELYPLARAGDTTAKRELRKKINKLKEAMDIKAEYSAATRATLMAQRGTSQAVAMVFRK